MKRFLPLIVTGIILTGVQLTAGVILLGKSREDIRALTVRLDGLVLEHRYDSRIRFKETLVPFPVPVAPRSPKKEEALPLPAGIILPLVRTDMKLQKNLDAGLAAWRSGRTSEAARIFREILSRSPSCPEASGWLAAVLYANGEGFTDGERLGEIRRLALNAAEAFVNFPEPYRLLGDLAVKEGNREQAIRWYAFALANAPRDAALLTLLGGFQ
jgi:tetratricopeptide (TPR) repeat protein